MLPSQTVENYLKTIYLAQPADAAALVPMGHLASALGVVPGTATTMVKALAESGLVRYEPYMGVRLTPAGEKLASLVLRRHRLVELFLVKVLGMSWADVHEEAERLEHAVSERVIERIDEYLGRPAVDPHGDPIPTAEGTMPTRHQVGLDEAPLAVPLVIERVLDQEPGFLRFVEERALVPGHEVIVDARDPAAETVQVRVAGAGDAVTISLGIASRVQVGSDQAQTGAKPGSAPS